MLRQRNSPTPLYWVCLGILRQSRLFRRFLGYAPAAAMMRRLQVKRLTLKARRPLTVMLLCAGMLAGVCLQSNFSLHRKTSFGGQQSGIDASFIAAAPHSLRTYALTIPADVRLQGSASKQARVRHAPAHPETLPPVWDCLPENLARRLGFSPASSLCHSSFSHSPIRGRAPPPV